MDAKIANAVPKIIKLYPDVDRSISFVTDSDIAIINFSFNLSFGSDSACTFHNELYEDVYYPSLKYFMMGSFTATTPYIMREGEWFRVEIEQAIEGLCLEITVLQIHPYPKNDRIFEIKYFSEPIIYFPNRAIEVGFKITHHDSEKLVGFAINDPAYEIDNVILRSNTYELTYSRDVLQEWRTLEGADAPWPTRMLIVRAAHVALFGNETLNADHDFNWLKIKFNRPQITQNITIHPILAKIDEITVISQFRPNNNLREMITAMGAEGLGIRIVPDLVPATDDKGQTNTKQAAH